MCAVIGHPLVRKSCSAPPGFCTRIANFFAKPPNNCCTTCSNNIINPLDWYPVRSHGPTNAFLVAYGGELGTVWELPWRRGICRWESSKKSEIRYPRGGELKLEARVNIWITSVWISGQLWKFAVKLQFMTSCVWLGLSAGLRTFTLVAFLFLSNVKWEKKKKEKHSDASLELSVTFLRLQVVSDCRLFRKLVLRFCFRCRCCFLALGVAGSIVWFFDVSVLVVEWLRVLCTF